MPTAHLTMSMARFVLENMSVARIVLKTHYFRSCHGALLWRRIHVHECTVHISGLRFVWQTIMDKDPWAGAICAGCVSTGNSLYQSKTDLWLEANNYVYECFLDRSEEKTYMRHMS